MRAFEKNRGLEIWDWYFSGRMETISMKKKGNERKECHKTCYMCLPQLADVCKIQKTYIYCYLEDYLSNMPQMLSLVIGD